MHGTHFHHHRPLPLSIRATGHPRSLRQACPISEESHQTYHSQRTRVGFRRPTPARPLSLVRRQARGLAVGHLHLPHRRPMLSRAELVDMGIAAEEVVEEEEEMADIEEEVVMAGAGAGD